MKQITIIFACLLSMNAMAQKKDPIKYSSGNGSAGYLIGTSSSWSIGQTYKGKTVFSVSQDSVLTVHDSKMAGRAIMEQWNKGSEKEVKTESMIRSGNELINFLLQKGFMSKTDQVKMNKLLVVYQKKLNGRYK